MKKLIGGALAAAALMILSAFVTPLNAPLHVPTNAALKKLSTVASPMAVRDGFTTSGDGGDALYQGSKIACSLNTGLGDDGSQVKSADNGCWLLVPTAKGIDIRVWGATQAADIVPFMAKAYAANMGVDILIPQGVWQVQSATTFSGTKMARFVGEGWAEYNQNLTCPTGSVQGTWLHEATAMMGTTPFTFSGSSNIQGTGGIKSVAYCQDHPAPRAVTASIAGTTLTVTAGTVNIGDGIGGAGVKPGTFVTAGTGPFTINNTQTVSSESMTAWHPNVYSPFISVLNVGGQLEFTDSMVYAVYDWISDTGPAAACGRHRFGIRGQPFHNALTLDNCQDVTTFDQWHLFPYWNLDASVINWQEVAGDMIIVGRVDGITAPSIFMYGYHSCLKVKTSPINPPSTISGGLFGTFYCDGTTWPIWVAGSFPSLHFDNAYLAGGFVPNSAAIVVEGSATTANIQIANLQCAVFGGGCILDTTAAGNSTFWMGSAYLHDLNHDALGAPVFTVASGNVVKMPTTPTVFNATGPLVNLAAGGKYEIPVDLTWTPAIAGTTAAGTATYIAQSGNYVVNGNKVHVTFVAALNTFSGATGNAQITGLPYLASTTSSGQCQFGFLAGFTFDTNYFELRGQINGATQVITLYEYGNAATPMSQAIPISKLPAGTNIQGSCTYYIHEWWQP
jgi:hypothetical protein